MLEAVRRERTGWRDEALSKRHRDWGFDCPAIDIDFLLVEYDRGVPIALVEYKHERADPIDTGHASYRALAELGDRAGIPVLAVRYAGDFSWWQVRPLNVIARSFVPTERVVTEQQWVNFLYRIRGHEPPRLATED